VSERDPGAKLVAKLDRLLQLLDTIPGFAFNNLVKAHLVQFLHGHRRAHARSTADDNRLIELGNFFLSFANIRMGNIGCRKYKIYLICKQG